MALQFKTAEEIRSMADADARAYYAQIQEGWVFKPLKKVEWILWIFLHFCANKQINFNKVYYLWFHVI